MADQMNENDKQQINTENRNEQSNAGTNQAGAPQGQNENRSVENPFTRIFVYLAVLAVLYFLYQIFHIYIGQFFGI